MITLDPDFQCYDIVSFISAGSHRFTLMSGKLTRPTATLPPALQVKHLFVAAVKSFSPGIRTSIKTTSVVVALNIFSNSA
jgi:hypothetical protein